MNTSINVCENRHNGELLLIELYLGETKAGKFYHIFMVTHTQ